MLRRIPLAQLWAATALVTSIIGGLWWTHAGPWRWLVEAQLAWLGGVALQLNILLLYAVMLPLLLVPLGIHHTNRSSPLRPSVELSWWQTGPGKSLLVGLMCFCIAAFSAMQALTAGSVQQVAATEIRASGAHRVRVPLEGAAYHQLVALDDDWYLPLMADGEVAAVLTTRVLGREAEPADFAEPEGMVGTFGVPGGVLAFWKKGDLEVRPSVPVVDLDASVGQKVFMAVLFTLIAVPTCLFGLWGWRSS